MQNANNIKTFKQIRFTIVRPITVHVTSERVSEATEIPLERITDQDIINFAKKLIEENTYLFNDIDIKTDMMFNDISTVYTDDVEKGEEILY